MMEGVEEVEKIFEVKDEEVVKKLNEMFCLKEERMEVQDEQNASEENSRYIGFKIVDHEKKFETFFVGTSYLGKKCFFK
jgi:hypothetical protein